jgi:hypothetical protein
MELPTVPRSVSMDFPIRSLPKNLNRCRSTEAIAGIASIETVWKKQNIVGCRRRKRRLE